MKRIALVTYRGKPGMVEPDDNMLIAPLAELNIKATLAAWDDSTIDWGRFDSVIIRSTWDYHSRVDEFNAWLHTLETTGVRLFNRICSASGREWD